MLRWRNRGHPFEFLTRRRLDRIVRRNRGHPSVTVLHWLPRIMLYVGLNRGAYAFGVAAGAFQSVGDSILDFVNGNS